MSDLQPVEEIWVTTAEGAEKTGFHLDHVRRLARENMRLPEDKRFIRLRKESNEYALWLPDLMDYTARNNPWADKPDEQPTDEIWVMTAEAAEITHYNVLYLQKLARDSSNLPEDQRLIKVRIRSSRYELWLPDLIAYLSKPRRGPHPKRTSSK